MAGRSGRWWQLNPAAGLQHPRYVAHQQLVPRLPVPSLAETCHKYLRAVLPLHTTDAAREATRRAVAAFEAAGGPGPALQAELLARDAALPRESSYVESLWYEHAYLGCRDPVPVGSNPSLLLRAEPWAQVAPLWRAATLVSSAARWQVALTRGELPPDVGRDGSARCMASLANVLGTARIPRPGLDAFSTATGSRHVIVLRRGAFFPMEVIGADGEAVPPACLLAALSAIRRAADALAAGEQQQPPSGRGGPPARAEPPPEPICNLTCLPRDAWAAARSDLLAASAVNRQSLGAIDEALLVLVLDEAAPASAPAALHEALVARPRPLAAAQAPAGTAAAGSAAARALAGGAGSDGGVGGGSVQCGRWYDKLQLVLFANGEAALNFEHSPVDGVQLLRLVDEIDAWAQQCGPPPADDLARADADAAPAPQRLRWELCPSVTSALDAAVQSAASLSSGVRAASLRLPGWTSQRSRRAGLGLDPLLQAAFQLAYRMDAPHAAARAAAAVGRSEETRGYAPPSVYEACSTVAFMHGRTETIRSASDASLAFADQAAAALAAAARAAAAPAQPGSAPPRDGGSDARLRALLAAACAAQSETTRWCQQGLGHERHLLALRALALERAAGADGGSPLPQIFSDAGWAALTTSTLSTSCLRSESIRGFSFGPVVPHGYGIAYIYDSDGVTVNVTSHTGAAARGADCDAYVGALAEAMAFIGRLLEGHTPSKL